MDKRDIENGVSARQARRYRAGNKDGQGVGGNLQHAVTASVVKIQNAR
ncbi:TPA: hypothetical protein PXO92_004419 [Yersinia enterocolitica]|nr:hypothetical protein [Yersinia enterocolitica]